MDKYDAWASWGTSIDTGGMIQGQSFQFTAMSQEMGLPQDGAFGILWFGAGWEAVTPYIHFEYIANLPTGYPFPR